MNRLLFNIISILLIVLFYSCDSTESPVQVDEEPPTGAFANPDQAVFGDVELVVIASDNEGVTRVVFEAHLDDQSLIIGVDSTSNENNEFSLHWSSGQFPLGEWEIHAIAYDVSGNKDSAVFHANLEIKLRSPALYIGQYYGGGIIFYLDASGEHGLIAAYEDHHAKLPWSNYPVYRTAETLEFRTGANSFDEIYGGEDNTRKIVESFGDGNYAAKICDNYVGLRPVIDWSTWSIKWVAVTDWYLPNYQELQHLYSQRDEIGGFVNTWDESKYWSSSELSEVNAIFIHFNNREYGNIYKERFYRVRPIRAF